MGVLHCATFAFGPSTRKANPTRVLTSLAAEEKVSKTEFEQFQEIMGDPEKMKKMQESVNQIFQDPEKKEALDKWMQSMTSEAGKKALDEWMQSVTSVAKRLKQDPELESVFKDLKDNGMAALGKYQDNESVMQKIAAAQAEL